MIESNNRMHYQLDDAEERHAQHPTTFELEDAVLRYDVQKGDLVKLCFDQCERMWVRVTEVCLAYYVGELDNHPIFLDLECGDPIHFEPRHIYDVCLRYTSRLD